MLSLHDDFKKAMRASKRPRKKPPVALTRYGYLLVQWPIVEDELAQSGGGAVMLGESDDLTISCGSHPKSKKARDQNLQRLRDDVKRILGSRYAVVEKKGYLFLQPRKR